MQKKSDNVFFPFALFEIAVTALATVEVVLLLAAFFPSDVGREIDFSAAYSPRPEWYFLFLYQLTKYFPGKWTFVGAVLLPCFAVSLVLLAPFLDRGRETSLRKRKAAATIGFGMLAVVVVLTLLAVL